MFKLNFVLTLLNIMAISNERKKLIKECVKSAVERIRKITELSFNRESHHKSGRSGSHGKKYNKIATAILNHKNDTNYLRDTRCFDNNEEKTLVVKEFEKHSGVFHNRAKSINHKS